MAIILKKNTIVLIVIFVTLILSITVVVATVLLLNSGSTSTNSKASTNCGDTPVGEKICSNGTNPDSAGACPSGTTKTLDITCLANNVAQCGSGNLGTCPSGKTRIQSYDWGCYTKCTTGVTVTTVAVKTFTIDGNTVPQTSICNLGLADMNARSAQTKAAWCSSACGVKSGDSATFCGVSGGCNPSAGVNCDSGKVCVNSVCVLPTPTPAPNSTSGVPKFTSTITPTSTIVTTTKPINNKAIIISDSTSVCPSDTAFMTDSASRGVSAQDSRPSCKCEDNHAKYYLVDGTYGTWYCFSRVPNGTSPTGELMQVHECKYDFSESTITAGNVIYRESEGCVPQNQVACSAKLGSTKYYFANNKCLMDYAWCENINKDCTNIYDSGTGQTVIVNGYPSCKPKYGKNANCGSSVPVPTFTFPPPGTGMLIISIKA
ncbi:MAG: hypothetical protein WCJ19_01305 [bacterium]